MAGEPSPLHDDRSAERRRSARPDARASDAAADPGSAARRRHRNPGLRGRRRAGPGENFWQYRRFVSGEPAARVDWRRSARDDIFTCATRMGSRAHGVDLARSLARRWHFASPLVRDTKLYRALVVALALAEVLVEGGERMGIPA